MLTLDMETARPNDCAFRFFQEGEHHIERRFAQSVLVMGLERTLYFEEEGKPVAVSPGNGISSGRDCFRLEKGAVRLPFISTCILTVNFGNPKKASRLPFRCPGRLTCSLCVL